MGINDNLGFNVSYGDVGVSASDEAMKNATEYALAAGGGGNILPAMAYSFAREPRNRDTSRAVFEGAAFGPQGAQAGYARNKIKARGSLNTDVPITQMPEEQQALAESQAEGIQSYKDYLGDMYPVVLAEQGYKEVDGQIIPLTEEEMLANMTPLEQQQYQNALAQQQYQAQLLPTQVDLAKAQAEYALKAQRGELEMPEYLQQDLDEMRQLENANLSARLGANYSQSSAGIQTADAAKRRESAIKSAYAHGEKTTAANLMNQSLGGISGVGNQSFGGYLSGTQAGQQGFLNATGTLGNLYGQVPGMYGQAQNPYMYYAGLQNQANMQSAANQAQLIGDVFGLAGTATGAAIGA